MSELFQFPADPSEGQRTRLNYRKAISDLDFVMRLEREDWERRRAERWLSESMNRCRDAGWHVVPDTVAIEYWEDKRERNHVLEARFEVEYHGWTAKNAEWIIEAVRPDSSIYLADVGLSSNWHAIFSTHKLIACHSFSGHAVAGGYALMGLQAEQAEQAFFTIKANGCWYLASGLFDIGSLPENLNFDIPVAEVLRLPSNVPIREVVCFERSLGNPGSVIPYLDWCEEKGWTERRRQLARTLEPVA